MPAFVRYDIYTRDSWTAMVHEFRTETEALHWASNFLPKSARNFDCYWLDPKDEHRQKPTLAYVDTLPNTAWKEETGRHPQEVTTRLEIVTAPRAPRRSDYANATANPRVPSFTTGYRTTKKARAAG
jgi:hypothetical protein